MTAWRTFALSMHGLSFLTALVMLTEGQPWMLATV